MQTQKQYRKGAVGAMMDEYERATTELKNVLMSISESDFIKIVDPNTQDEDCRSVSSIMNHVVRAGYGYANYIRKQFGDEWTERQERYEFSSPQDACSYLDKMLQYTEDTLADKLELTDEQIVNNKMITSWGQPYDVEQLLEHAIVHILRHRRQIEKFLMIIESA